MGSTHSGFCININNANKDDLEVWNTTIDANTASMLGHTNTERRGHINYFLEKLPKVDPDPNITVGCTGYWDKKGEITAPLYAQTTDSTGRPMFFIDNNVIIQRYTTTDSLVYYNRDGDWSHTFANALMVGIWREKVLKWEESAVQDTNN